MNVRPRRPEGERLVRPAGLPRPDDETLYAEFYRRTAGEDPPAELVALFREVLEEVADASA